MSALDNLIRPRSVAIVGASADPTRTTGRPVAYLQKHGFSGRIYPVNPRVEEVSGLRCYPDVLSLPSPPDVGLVLLGPERAHGAVADLAKIGASAAIVLASGYAETGLDGQQDQQALKDVAGNMRLLGPNTIGMLNLTDGIVLSATGALESAAIRPGRISVVSQSGGVLGALLSRAASRGIGFAKLIATGNEADLDAVDIMEFLLEDEATSVIVVYLEGLRRPEVFRDVAARGAQAGKSIVVFKTGRSELGARSALSHTGALAGAERTFEAFFRQCGTIRAYSFGELLDIPAALSSGRRLRGARVAVLTTTGGIGTLLADSCGLAGLDLPPPDASTANHFAAIEGVDAGTAARNPFDLTLAGLRPELLRKALAALVESPAYDAVVVVVGSSALARPELVADAVIACQRLSQKPLLVYVSPFAPKILALMNASGIPATDTPENIPRMLDALREKNVGNAEPGSAPKAFSAAPRIPPDLRSGSLNEAESKALFRCFGIASVREEAVADAAEAERAARSFAGNVVLKVLSRDIVHKSDVGGVRIDVQADDVRRVCGEMLADVRRHTGAEPEGVLVGEFVRDGLEVILGMHRDAQLGPVILVGLGGTMAELFEDASIRLLPLTHSDAGSMLGELKLDRLLSGFRNSKPRDRDALVGAIVAFAAMVETLGERLVEAEINPLLVMPQGEGVRAADGLAILR